MNETPEPFRPTLRTQAALEQAWTYLMQPLGFTGHSVWMMLIDAGDQPLLQLTELEDCHHAPRPQGLEAFAELAGELLAEHAPGGRWAFLLSRPGGTTVTDLDRTWARGLLAACRDAGVATDVVHLATDVAVVPLPWDELASVA